MSIDRTVTLANWLEPPFNRESFQRVREVVPTAAIANRTHPVQPLPESPVDLSGLHFPDGDGRQISWDDHLAQTYADAVVIVQRGELVYERYVGDMQADTPHLLMSVSKSVCAAALGITIGQGSISAADLVTHVAPEFGGTNLDGATVQHLIDMTAGTEFVEDYALYADPSGDNPLVDYERQAGYRPLRDREPIGVLGSVKQMGTAFAHGDHFDYRSPLTNVVARLLEIVHGERFPDVVSRLVWGPLGMEHGADIMVDPLGYAVTEGGMSCTARDLVRFGMAYLEGGVVPADWITDTHTANDDALAAFAARTGDPDLDEWSHYRNAFWVLDRGRTFTAWGIFGQYCWIDVPTQTVIARFSSYPAPEPPGLDDQTLRGFAAATAYLSR